MAQIESLEGTLSILSCLLSVAIAVIIVGLALEFPSLTKWRRSEIGAALVILGIAAELGLHIWSEHVGDKIRTIQRAEIISLQKRLLPRSLPVPAQRRVADKVCPFGPQSFNILPIAYGDPEFIGQLARVIELCKWTPVGLPNRNEVISAVSDSVGVRLMFERGRPELESASKAFSDALVAEGIVATAEAANVDVPIPPGMILIVISAKP